MNKTAEIKMLVIGTENLTQTDIWRLLSEELYRLQPKLELYVFKQDTCLRPNGDIVTFKVRAGCTQFTLKIDGVNHDLQSFDRFYYNHPILPKDLILFPQIEYRRFIHAQFWAMRKALCQLATKKSWLNHPDADFRAEEKIYQLQVATEVGLVVPDTLITSDPDTVRDFYASCPSGMIVKTIDAVPIPDNVIFTHFVTEQELQRIDSVRSSPSIFQPYCEKAYELRVIVVGKRIFVGKVLSQEDEATRIDWRAKPASNGSPTVGFEIGDLPQDVAEKILMFMRRMDLCYGAIDMIVTPDGEHIFLEVNPIGQWYFIQNATGLQIAAAIAHELLNS